MYDISFYVVEISGVLLIIVRDYRWLKVKWLLKVKRGGGLSSFMYLLACKRARLLRFHFRDQRSGFQTYEKCAERASFPPSLGGSVSGQGW